MTKFPSTVQILLPLPIGQGYDYLMPEDMDICPGSLVEVPLGSRFMVGVAWGPGSGLVPVDKLKSVGQVLPLHPITEATRKFVDWVAAYTVSPPGNVLKMVMGAKWKIPGPKDTFTAPQPDPDFQKQQLTEDQQEAANKLLNAVDDNCFSVTLLDGVTGSGKTEVYDEAIAAALNKGKQALVLLPEIAMTAAMIDRFAERFGARPLEWHSELSDKQRRINWHAIAQGKAKFVLGARSALMLPYSNLGLIVVDEEHEAAYKQEDGVTYHGRDMAVVRARLENIPVVLSSATPSLETTNNVQQGKYGHVVLHERFGKAEMPEIKIVDLRKENLSAQSFISAPLVEALNKTIANEQQAMLFLNRRGYAPLTLCRACGHRLQCPNCTSWLIAHKRSGKLHCHHCDYSMALPRQCPTCKAEGKFAACGPGVERIAEEIKQIMPNVRCAIMASDTLSGPKAAQELINQMQDKSLDLLIGTQIMAKGYHFPRLTLVGVIDADIGLGGGDPRAAEHTFQLLQQVAGRSGRAEDPGTVYIQTTQPSHPVMKALAKGDRDSFMAAEMNERRTYNLPPFSRLASITVTGTDQKQVISAINQVAASAPLINGLKTLGPAPAPFAILRGRYRYRLMVQSSKQTALSAVLREWISNIKLSKSLRLQIDVDPYNFL